MDRVRFDTIARRAAGFLDRRSLFAGLSAAALAAAGLRSGASAKGKHHHRHGNNRRSDACKKRVKECREEILPGCQDSNDVEGCEKVVNTCCKKACRSNDKAIDCLANNL